MQHLIWVTNIPTPYRNHRYRVFSELLPNLGINFEVAYMADTEPDREWEFTNKELNYPHKFFRGFHPQIRGVYAHTNPGLFRYIHSQQPDILVLGGYSAPTLIALGLAPPSKARVLLAAESNLDSPFRRTTGPAVAIKQRIVGKCSGFIVPGPRSQRYLEHIDASSASKPVFELPNIVEESLYRDKIQQLRKQRNRLRQEMRIQTDDRVWLIPARLHPIKGLDRFLPLFKEVRNSQVLIAGDGPQRLELETLCKSQRIRVTFLGTATEEEMLKLYSIADLFALPSLQDASPLSAVEALAAGLPVMLSERAGNVDEVVGPSNGWRYDPDKPTKMKSLIDSINKLHDDQLKSMGEKSRQIFAENFDSTRCVTRLGQALVTMGSAG